MSDLLSFDRLRFLAQRLRWRSWARPLAICLLSVGMAFGAHLADGLQIGTLLPGIAGGAHGGDRHLRAGGGG